MISKPHLTESAEEGAGRDLERAQQLIRVFLEVSSDTASKIT
jgi:hypothetical protein